MENYAIVMSVSKLHYVFELDVNLVHLIIKSVQINAFNHDLYFTTCKIQCPKTSSNTVFDSLGIVLQDYIIFTELFSTQGWVKYGSDLLKVICEMLYNTKQLLKLLLRCLFRAFHFCSINIEIH